MKDTNKICQLLDYRTLATGKRSERIYRQKMGHSIIPSLRSSKKIGTKFGIMKQEYLGKQSYGKSIER